MLSDCEKMLVIPPTTNEWPQVDDQKVPMASSGRIMEKPGQELLQQQQQALKCPRCDSSNTKFCYYNNYSLSQPRHFCKACKRYWTRGGTLRNVPVGGGCRKNKRVKRPASNSAIDNTSSTSSSVPSSNSNPNSQPQIDVTSTSNPLNPLLYGLQSNSSDMNFPFQRFNPRIPSLESISGFDLQPHLNSLGLGFSSGIISNEAGGNNGYKNGFGSNNSLSFLSSYNSMFGSSSSSTPTTPLMASLLSSTLQQQKFINGGLKDCPNTNTFHGLAPLEELQIAGNGSETEMVHALKEVKVEEGQNRLEWNSGCQNQMDQQHVGLSDPNSSLYWNVATAMGAWNDQTNNIGPSVTSLI